MRSRGSSLSLELTAAGAPGPTAEESFSYTTYSIVSARICLGLADFLPFGICVPGQVHQLAEVLRCLLAVACAVGSAGSSPERAEAVGGLLERGLELVQGSCGLAHLKQQFRQQFAERIEAILHRHVLEATVFAIGGCAHGTAGRGRRGVPSWPP